MALKLHEVTTEDEFSRVVAVEHRGYNKPFNGFWEVLKGPSQEECAARQWSWHKADPTSHWLYVTDSATGQVLGGMEWNIHETNPYANGPPVVTAYWWPDGPLKQIGDQLFSIFFGARPSRMGQPHLLINYCFVDPDHRHRGVASLMMEWGTKKADEMGLDSFVESTEDGRGFYEAHGFKVFDEAFMAATADEPSAEFSQLVQELQLPSHAFYMKRPVSK